MDNLALKSIYEQVYSQGKENFFTFSTADVSQEVMRELDWADKQVLEVGCGTGETAYLIALAGGHILGIDYASSAIEEANRRHQHPHLRFETRGLEEATGVYDVVVMQEVIEHTDDPAAALAALRKLAKPDGHIIVTCPSFVNLRGIVWMTLQTLLQVPMSLTDKHFIIPANVEAWAAQVGLTCRWRTFRYSQAHGEDMITDMRKRLTNALRDAKLDNSRVELLLDWLKQVSTYVDDADYNGAKALYHLTLIAS